MSKKKIIIVTPRFPFPPKGACDGDRSHGILDFLGGGFGVKILTKVADEQKAMEAKKIGKAIGAEVFPFVYNNATRSGWRGKLRRLLFALKNPAHLDGAAFEYEDAAMKAKLNELLNNFRPDAVYFDYTYLWPLYGVVRKHKVPIVTRSLNWEPIHFLDEDGWSVWNLLRALPKFLSEFIVARQSALLFSITPKEEKIYRRFARGMVLNLPLRGLHKFLDFKYEVREKEVLDIFFMASTYNVHHNLEALCFVVNEVAKEARTLAPGRVRFHLFGSKLPEGVKIDWRADTIYHGYVEDLNSFLSDMDVAVIPSLFGSGMQQKIFEPLARGIPTATSSRGLAGYPFQDGVHLLCAESARDFAEAIVKLIDPSRRAEISHAAQKLSRQLFSEEKILAASPGAISELLAHR
jgi:glycosyltransferase involved in cell wall biosynthesis